MDRDPKVREQAAIKTGDLGASLGSTYTARLGVMLKDRDPKVRRAAADALQCIGPSAYAAVPQLINALKDEDVQVRWKAAVALSTIGPLAKDAVPALIEATKDKQVKVRTHAINALGNIGLYAKKAVPVLADVVLEPDGDIEVKDGSRVRLVALIALGNIGPAAEQALPALRKLLQTADLQSKGFALRSLAKIAPHDEALVNLLKENLKHKDVRMQCTAADGLGELGADARAAVPDLLKALEADYAGTAEHAKRFHAAILNALGEIGPAAKEAVPALKRWATDPQVGPEAERALKRVQGSK
jgi:HEAT repeat protein